MNIRGTMGVCDGDVKSATYGVGQLDEFTHDAAELGFVLGTITPDYVSVKNTDGLITGEFSSRYGGQLAWSV